MNRSPLKSIALLMCFTLCKGIDCDNGWVPGTTHCYQLVSIPRSFSGPDSCKHYATTFPYGLVESLGFSEKVWIKENNVMKAIDLSNENHQVVQNGNFYSMCEATLSTNATFQVYNNVKFDEGQWTIPNSKYILDEMDTYLQSKSLDMVWVGLVFNGSGLWSYGIEATGTQEVELNIPRPPGGHRQCAVFSVGKKISFRDCYECRKGIETSTGNIYNRKTSTCPVITTEQTTQMITIQTSELTTETETTATTDAPTSTTITETITTEEEIVSSTFDLSEKGSLTLTTETRSLSNTAVSSISEQITRDYDNRPNITNDTATTTIPTTGNSTFDQMTTDNDTATTTIPATGSSTFDPPKICYCPCPKHLNKSEFMESIQDIKIKPTEVSKYIRSKTSAPDDRTSSRAIGTIAAVIMVIPFGVIVLADLPLLLKPFWALIQRKKLPKNTYDAML